MTRILKNKRFKNQPLYSRQLLQLNTCTIFTKPFVTGNFPVYVTGCIEKWPKRHIEYPQRNNLSL
jgi:hypothetical protein